MYYGCYLIPVNRYNISQNVSDIHMIQRIDIGLSRNFLVPSNYSYLSENVVQKLDLVHYKHLWRRFSWLLGKNV